MGSFFCHCSQKVIRMQKVDFLGTKEVGELERLPKYTLVHYWVKISNHPCMVHLPTFTIEINQMQV